ncbi:serine/threonine-protein kinase [Melittangium boletus]|uniref:Protein kinase domain-containing protein n=1 Tax=Melittangium boletus DSM 14713 TaxID=1294270 RepID=A0A250ID86_9BACT|nr:serine/threonine-protein kinase [Melittangium boletus]ATB29170.1 hypothetical protein MEBOL_002619 [Melittangium boletus DSM 14713]
MSQSECHAQPLEPHRELMPGQWLRHYELIRELSGGGPGGGAYLARDTRTGRRVTIHFPSRLPPVTARLFHENIVAIQEVGQDEDGAFLVLEYLQGQSLRTLVHHERLPPARAVELMAPVLRALAHAHDQGVVHGDLRPDNLLVTDTGVIKVLGFGLSRTTQEMEEEPATDPRTDLWAVGIMLFQMLSGVTPRLDAPMPRLQELLPALPPDLAAVVDRCLLENKDERFADARSLLRALEPFLPGHAHREPLASDSCPYPGLSAFQEADADRFFGRAREVTALLQRLRDRPLLAVVGPSGAGKSSLVHAGLVPALERSGNDWRTLVMRPGQHPLSALARLLEQAERPSDVFEEDSPRRRELVRRLYAEPGYAGQVLRALAQHHHHELLVFIDSFEELYARVPDVRERRAFTECLMGIADDTTSPLRVLLALRTDRMDAVSEDERFMTALSQGLFFLAPLRGEGLCEALVRPAERAGYSFEMPILVDGLLQDLESSPDALPLLQFAATTMWEARDPDTRRLTVRAHETQGGVTGVLARHADEVLANLLASEQELTRRLCSRLVAPSRTRATATLDELRALTNEPEEPRRLIEHLARMRLLRLHGGADDTDVTVELVHESLIHGWPPLRRWLDERQEDTALPEREARQGRARMLAGVVFVGALLLATSVGWVHARGAQRRAELQAERARAEERMALDAEARAREAAREARRELERVLIEQQERHEEWRAWEETHREVVRLTEELFHREEELFSALRRLQKASPTRPASPRHGSRNAEALLRRERERIQGLEARIAPMLQLLKRRAWREQPAGPFEEMKR